MPYNYTKLNGRVVEICGSQAKFADEMGLSERSVSLKLNGKIGWKQSEMYKASTILKFPVSEIPEYFFVLEVQN